MRSRSPFAFVGDVPISVIVRGSSYAGTASIVQTKGDSVSGTVTLTGPVEVKGALRGVLSTSRMQIDLVYTIALNGCRGTMKLSAPVVNDAQTIEGPVDAQDSCVGAMTGTFRLGKLR